MANSKYESLASHKIVNHLYDERKDFIILGLCGRVGSGVSTVSDILTKDFDELQLPKPGFDNPDLYAAHEYRILYTYAKENWKKFFKIRTSALITRRILNGTVDEFTEYLAYLRHHGDQAGPQCTPNTFTDTAQAFFDKKMELRLPDLFRDLNKAYPSDICAPWRLIEYNESMETLVCNAKADPAAEDIPSPEQEIRKKILFREHNVEIEFSYNMETEICSFRNKEISKLVDAYDALRREKAGFHNPLWYLLLKQYLYEFLPRAATDLWSKVRSISDSLPTLALQCLGNNLRLNKKPYYKLGEESLLKNGYVCLAEDINLAIKVLRAYQLKLHESVPHEEDTLVYDPDRKQTEIRTIIVIDSIKNPYESLYLKARYNNYYLIGVYTEDKERRSRLREREHFVDDDIRAIDMIEQNTEFKKGIKEYRKWVKDPNTEHTIPAILLKIYTQFDERGLLNSLSFISPFVLQNVSSCLDSADILINNQKDNKSYAFLKRTLLRYVCLIMNPGIVLPTPVERCMQIANVAKLNSGCISRQVGAVVTDSEFHLLSVGWNQQPEGQLPCSYRDLCELYHHWNTEAYSDYENDDQDKFQEHIKDQVENLFDTPNSPLCSKGKLPRYCFKDYYNSIVGDHNQVHTRALHAEETAFLNLGASKDRVEKGILFTTSSPCELCSKKAMYLGISTIYYVEAYAGVSQKHVLNIGTMKRRPNLILFTGAIGTAYTKLFTPLLPQKDENEMWLGAKMDIELIKKSPQKILQNK